MLCLWRLALVRRPGSISLVNIPRRLRLAAPDCSSEPRSRFGKTYASIFRTLCIFETAMRRADMHLAAPRHPRGNHARVAGQSCGGVGLECCQWAPTPSCTTQLAQLRAVGGLAYKAEPGASGAAIGHGGRKHTRGSGRYPDASHGPSPPHLSETRALGTASPTLDVSCVRFRRLRPAAARGATS